MTPAAESAESRYGVSLNYEDFKKEAMSRYAELPDETNELYKKYHMETSIPSAEEMERNEKTAASASDVQSLVASIEQRTGLKFDIVLSRSFAKSMSENVQIKKTESIPGILSDKIYKSSDNRLAAFINANARDAIVAEIKPGSHEKFNMIFINDSDISFECLFKLGEGARLEAFQVFASIGKGSTCASLQEFSIAKGAHMGLTLFGDMGTESTLVSLSKGILEENGTMNANFIYNGSKLTKSINFFDTRGTGSKISVSEAIYGTGEQRFDINTHLLNSKERSSTKLETGAILDDRSHCLLKGYAKIEKYAKGAFSNISQRGILLSEASHIDALPDMSIDYSDQVSATHSAATSPIDKEALFYLMSRGLSDSSSRKMFVSSFILKYLGSIKDPAVKEIVSSAIISRTEGNPPGEMRNITLKDIWFSSEEGRNEKMVS